jgi:RHS repeat-associated protein
MNELLAQEGDTNHTYTYDEYGNCIAKDGGTTWEYTYDDEKRLLSVKKDGQCTEQYVYDGDGKRIKRIDPQSTSVYIYMDINILYEKNLSTQMEALYVYGTTRRIAKKVNDITEYYHTDHLGSTRLTTSETGATVARIRYKPFGEHINTTEERYTYNGKELDNSGLYYYGARYYDANTGRFITRDAIKGEIKNPQSLNSYSYCLNNPTRYADPTGLNAEDTVRDIFEHLLKLSPEDLEPELEELLEQAKGNLVKLLEILGNLLRKMGFEVTVTTSYLEVEFEPGRPTAIIEINEEACKKENSLGFIDWSTGKIYISYLQHNTVADLVTTVLHELCHRALAHFELRPREEEFVVYNIQREYMGMVTDMSESEGRTPPYSLTYRFSIWINWVWYSLPF